MTKIYEVFSWPNPTTYPSARPKIYHFKNKEIADKFAKYLDEIESDYVHHEVKDVVLYDDFEIAKTDYERLLESYKEEYSDDKF